MWRPATRQITGTNDGVYFTSILTLDLPIFQYLLEIDADSAQHRLKKATRLLG